MQHFGLETFLAHATDQLHVAASVRGDHHIGRGAGHIGHLGIQHLLGCRWLHNVIDTRTATAHVRLL